MKGQLDEPSVTTEEEYRALLAELMGLARFEDALRVLDRVTFFLEARDPLIWDLSAQFELFRAILTPTHSEELRRLEAEIVSADSSARNLNAVLYKLVTRRDSQQAKKETAAETRARLAKATAELEEAEAAEIKLQARLEAAEERRADARILVKRTDRAADDAASKYEEIKFDALRHAFAGVTPNEQYVFLKIISERVCLACGNEAMPRLKSWSAVNRRTCVSFAVPNAMPNRTLSRLQLRCRQKPWMPSLPCNPRATTMARLGRSTEVLRMTIDPPRSSLSSCGSA